MQAARGERDSLIQRFEYSYELFWKFLKKYAEHQFITLESTSPRGIIRICVQSGILTEEQGSFAAEMHEYRNKTSHMYREEIADIISEHVPEFYTFMRTVSQHCMQTYQEIKA